LFGVYDEFLNESCDAHHLYSPQQIAFFQNNLWVTDSSNSRVLKLSGASTVQSRITSAANVFGQADFTSCDNIVGDITGPGLDFPVGVVTDNNGTLWVADASAKVIKRFDNAITLGNYPIHDAYLGTGVQAVTQNDLVGPGYMGIDKLNGHLFVTDSTLFGSGRVLIFKNAQSKGNSANADVVLGQIDFTAKGPKSCTPSAMDTPGEPFYDSVHDTLYLPDLGCQRVTVFYNVLNAANGASADYVIAQKNLSALEYYPINVFSLLSPFGIDYNSVTGLLITDSNLAGTNRVVRHNCVSISTQSITPLPPSNSPSKSQPKTHSKSQTKTPSETRVVVASPSQISAARQTCLDSCKKKFRKCKLTIPAVTLRKCKRQHRACVGLCPAF